MHKTRISLIAALSENRAIGVKGKLPWHIPQDLKRFRQLTSGHVVIMGRKTFESIGKPLPNRVNIVISRSLSFQVGKNLFNSSSVSESIALANSLKPEGDREIFVIGGGQLYAETISMADKLYLTLVDGEIIGDTFFPDFSGFGREVYRQRLEKGERGASYSCTFVELEKNQGSGPCRRLIEKAN